MPERVDYGSDPSQYAELSRPRGHGRVRGVVVVIHGGFWRSAYDASLGRPLARSLADRGWVAWNLEYRRVGNGGGVPETLDDVADGIDALADVADLDLGTVIALGHSAGGHLAVWAAGRVRFPRWAPARVPVTAVLSLAGVVDLASAHADGLGSGAVAAFVGAAPGSAPDSVDPLVGAAPGSAPDSVDPLVGAAPGSAPDSVDPLRQVPLGVPVWCVHGRDDDVVPISQSRAYVEAARAAGGRAELVPVDGDHFTVVDPGSTAWAATLRILDSC